MKNKEQFDPTGKWGAPESTDDLTGRFNFPTKSPEQPLSGEGPTTLYYTPEEILSGKSREYEQVSSASQDHTSDPL